MVIKHDEEMAQNKMKVDKLLWGVGGWNRGWVFKEKEHRITQNRNKDSVYCRAPAGRHKWCRVTERCLDAGYCRAPAGGLRGAGREVLMQATVEFQRVGTNGAE